MEHRPDLAARFDGQPVRGRLLTAIVARLLVAEGTSGAGREAAFGDPPFWGYPWVSLRGVPALRYQNDVAGVVAAELRWNLFDRWATVLPGGVGATTGDFPLFIDESGIAAGGIGGRYLFRPQDSLWVGIDLAHGPEDDILYVQVRHAW